MPPARMITRSLSSRFRRGSRSGAATTNNDGKKKKKNTKRVSFQEPAVPQVSEDRSPPVVVQEETPVDEENLLLSLWYSEQELKQVRKESLKTIRELKRNNGDLDALSGQHCLRGLEDLAVVHVYNPHAPTRRDRQSNHSHTIIDEQRKQNKLRICDLELIRRISRAQTRSARKLAHTWGLQDAQEAEEVYAQDDLLSIWRTTATEEAIASDATSAESASAAAVATPPQRPRRRLPKRSMGLKRMAASRKLSITMLSSDEEESSSSMHHDETSSTSSSSSDHNRNDSIHLSDEEETMPSTPKPRRRLLRKTASAFFQQASESPRDVVLLTDEP